MERKVHLVLSYLTISLVLIVFYWWLSGNLFGSIVIGAALGGLFPLAVVLFSFIAKRSKIFGLKQIEGWSPTERIVHSGDANHVRDGIAEGGRLFLSNKRLRFVGHRISVQVNDRSFIIGDIVDAQPCRTLGIIPNGLNVNLRDGRVEKFVVYERMKWVAMIRKSSSKRSN